MFTWYGKSTFPRSFSCFTLGFPGRSTCVHLRCFESVLLKGHSEHKIVDDLSQLEK